MRAAVSLSIAISVGVCLIASLVFETYVFALFCFAMLVYSSHEFIHQLRKKIIEETTTLREQRKKLVETLRKADEYLDRLGDRDE
jgi:hypothetical protein